MNRREFIKTASALAGVAATSSILEISAAELPMPTPQKLPRWRGFNLLEKFTKYRGGNPPFQENDFIWMAEWGFNFVRLPMSYLCWTDPNDWMKLEEKELAHIDQAVEFGRKHGIHVNMNFHRAPGYCVNPPKEPLDLWKDDKALDACAFHWGQFAKRYKGIPNNQVSFDLLNEPGDLKTETYARVVKRLVESIRAEDPQRLIIADGLRWGNKPVPKLLPLSLGQSTRGYQPMRISHHKANWVSGSDKWAEPTWPLEPGSKDTWNQERLRRECILPWKDLEKKGGGVHVGEWGTYNRTPHKATLAWMHDFLELWKEAGWGWSLWNFRGSFGIMDSGRTDVAFEDFHGHKLDREILTLLQAW